MSIATVAPPRLQMPSCLHVPPSAVGSWGDDVAEVAERLGRAPTPSQKVALDALVSYDRRGRFVSTEAGLEGPRQTVGKTGGIMLPVAMWSALTDPDHITWTAHQLDTSNKVFHELTAPGKGLIDSNDWLRRRVKSVSFENGAEGVSFVNGAQLDFRARSARRGRGITGSTVFVDEALESWTAETAGALLPILATRSVRGTARAYYFSSAALEHSAFLRSLRRRALAADPSLTFVGWWARGDWTVPGCAADECSHEAGVAQGCALDDESRWLEANPGVPDMVSLDFLATMRRTLVPLVFGREFMGWQVDGGDAVDLDRWGKLADPSSKPLPRPLGLGWAVSPGGKSAAVVAVGRRADGMLHVELLAHETGTAWLGPWLRAKQGELDVQVWHRAGKVPEAAAVRGLRDAGVTRLREVPVAGYAVACDSLDRAVNGRTLRHLGDPRLAVALGAVVRRDVGDGLWEMTWRGSQGDCAPAMAMIPALHGLLQYPAAGQSANFG